ncbi:MAG: DUF1214 domain-containing protein [Pseudomonadota bacterium]
MHNPLHTLIAIALGLFLGLATAWLALEQNWGFDRVTLGPWIGEPRAGGVDADPYTRALIVQQAQIPLGGGEGVAFNATIDNDGETLRANCTYIVRGSALPTRWWTLTVSDPSGALFTNPLGRHGFTSQEVARTEDGEFRIIISSRVQPWNWLPIPPDGPLRLTLRFYDTPLTTAAGLQKQELPAIRKEGCV